MAKDTLYDQLGLPPQSGQDEIEQAWRRIREQGRVTLEQRMAYSLLSNAKKKARYDDLLANPRRYRLNIGWGIAVFVATVLAAGFLAKVLLVDSASDIHASKTQQSNVPTMKSEDKETAGLDLFHGALLQPKVAQSSAQHLSIFGCRWKAVYGDKVEIACTGGGTVRGAGQMVRYRVYDGSTLVSDRFADGPQIPAAGTFEISVLVPKRSFVNYEFYVR